MTNRRTRKNADTVTEMDRFAQRLLSGADDAFPGVCTVDLERRLEHGDPDSDRIRAEIARREADNEEFIRLQTADPQPLGRLCDDWR